jgi:pimeloyl-ACP methyl ester carboxylesterase/DNA-binding CsgD family transcriptional regulator
VPATPHPPQSVQRIRTLRADDGVTLAWAETGSGPTLVKAAHWLTHLQYEWDSPLWRHWLQYFASRFRLVRYDERGFGMSEREVGDTTLERSTADLETVVEATAPGQRFLLLGISHGAASAIDYTVRHPDRVEKLILYGSFKHGIMRSDNEPAKRRFLAMLELLRSGWAKDNPTFRQLFTTTFLTEATPQQIEWFNDHCLKATTPQNAVRVLELRSQLDITELLPQVRVPTLVLHTRGDRIAPLWQAKIIAATIPDAEFVELDSPNHILLEEEPAWSAFCAAIDAFAGVGDAAIPGADGQTAFAALSTRERDVLALLTEGLANAQIAGRLAISEKTVRNHLSSIFDKLGVWTRAQAIVFARDHGFRT